MMNFRITHLSQSVPLNRAFFETATAPDEPEYWLGGFNLRRFCMGTKNERREPHMTSSDTTSPILITGATGRHGGTGAPLARRLPQAGPSVRGLVGRLE